MVYELIFFVYAKHSSVFGMMKVRSAPDLVQLHSIMIKNVASVRKAELKKALETCCAEKSFATRDLKRLRECARSEDRTKRCAAIPKMREARIRFESLCEREKKLSADSSSDHLTEYLLESIPLLNIYHRVNADIRFEKDAVRREELESEKRLVVEKYVRKYFPQMIQQLDQRENKRLKSQLSKKSGVQKTKCCGAYSIQGNDCSIICEKCGLVIAQHEVMIANPQRNLSYSRNVSQFKSYSYRRVNHLREWIRCYTGRTLINLRPEDFQRVVLEVKKQTVPQDRIDADFVRKLLKRIKLNAHYEQSTSIARKLNPKLDVIELEPEYEEKLILQFVTIEKPFETVRGKVDKKRKNFLSYGYVFYRLNQLNNREELNRDVRLLKSVRLIIRQDAFWKLICSKLKWTYKGNSVTI